MKPTPVGQDPPPLDPRPSHRPPPGRDTTKGKRQARNRFECINAFVDTTMGSLAGVERATWLVLWRDTKPNGLAATSQASIARRAGCTERAVRKALKKLVAMGLVAVVRQGNLRKGPSSYRVHPLAKGP